MTNLIYTIVYQPLFNLLIILYNIVPFADLGIAVVLITILIKTILYPLGVKAARSQKEMQKIQPEIKKIQEKYKDDKEQQAKKVMEVYKDTNTNPFSGIFPLFIQLPILISLFQIFRRGLENEEMIHLYNFVSAPQVINPIFLGIIDLSSPNVIIAILAGLGQYLQMKMTMAKKENDSNKESKKDMAKTMQSHMTLFLPGFTFVILLSLPSVVGLYWLITITFSLFQQYMINKEE